MKQILIEKHKIIEYYSRGDSPAIIASKVGVSVSTIYKVLKNNDIKLRKRKPIINNKIDLDEKKVIDLIVSGIPVSDVSDEIGVGRHIIYKILKKNNIKPGGKRSHRHVPHNKENVDIETMKKLHRDGKTTKEISLILGQKSYIIRSRLKNVGLNPNVTWKEATNLKSQIGNFVYDKLSDKKWLFDKYVEQGLSTRQISEELKCGKKTVNTFVSKHGFKKHDVKISKDEFVAKARQIHGNKYDYSRVEYKSYQNHVLIGCSQHGDFWQVPKYHIGNKNGCPLCAGTHLQSEIFDFINSITDGKVINNDRMEIYPDELDIFVSNDKIAIEVNGTYWHSYDHVEDNEERNRHLNKLNKCINLGIFLVQIAEYEWREKRPIIESILRSKIGNTKKIYARKCNMIEIDVDRYKDFININHLQGYNHSHAIYGLECDEELVSVMSFNRHKKYGWEITRFANKLGTTVVGGASKLFKRFVKDHAPEQVLSYADRRYSNGNLYKKLGFELDGVTKPNYVYIKGSKHYSRQKFMKHKLKNKLEIFDPDLTEAQNMFNNGYRRLWDAGNYRFIWSKT